MAFMINTYDTWGMVHDRYLATLQEARQVFASLREDPWYSIDGVVKGIELV